MLLIFMDILYIFDFIVFSIHVPTSNGLASKILSHDCLAAGFFRLDAAPMPLYIRYGWIKMLFAGST